VAAAFAAGGALWAETSADAAEADALFAARKLAYPALERLGPVLTEDVCVPRRRSRRCSRPSTGSPPSTRCGSRPSRTPATATCTH
jgi:hypothetical protein